MKSIKIDDLSIGKDYNYFILTDTAFSHEGNIKYLKKQIDSAFEGNVNGVKFQILLDVEDSYEKGTEIYDNFKKWGISEDSWKEILTYTKSKNLETVVLPIDLKSLKFVKENLDKIDALEIHSICLNEVPFIRIVRDLPINIILGVGGRTLEDIDFVLREIKANTSTSSRNIILMYGFQSFPTNYEKLNLSKLETLKKKFNLVLGYADHTSFEDYKKGNEIIKFAFNYGVRLFEKHLVVEKGVKRIDYEAAISSRELLLLRNDIESLIKTLGRDDLTKLNEVEIKYRDREKKIFVIRNLKKGEILKEEDLSYKVTKDSTDLEQKDYERILNKTLKADLNKGSVLKSKYIEF